MRTWSPPDVPSLPGSGPPLRLYDSSTREVRPTAVGDVARMYVCGITPYDATHVGHAATYVSFDVINRVLRDAGHDVHYVQNVTDVDDPLLERAVATGEDWRALADRETALFRKDMTALSVIPPRDYLGAVESIPLIVEDIQQLQQAGSVYELGGDLIFSVDSDPRFGEVAGLDVHTMRHLAAERGGRPNLPGKRNPLDCLLWQTARPEEPAWDTPLGHGRPGWHIECTAIALRHLGMPFDIQGGGRDLAFPHHECGASQAHVLGDGWPFARHYVHTAMVGLDGHKMSKSRGNLVFVGDLLASGTEPDAIRLAVLQQHYRRDWQWQDCLLRDADVRLGRWRNAVAHRSGGSAAAVRDEVRRHLADDLNAPAAIAAIDRWAAETSRGRGGPDSSAGAQMTALADGLLGIRL